MSDIEMNQISIAASVIYRKSQIWKTEQCADLGLSAAQVPVVLIVCRKDGISQNELGEMLSMDKSTVAKLIGKLVQSGYLLRTTNAKDKRAFDLMPTDKARATFPRLSELGAIWENNLTNGMTEKEKATLHRLLAKATQNANDFIKGIYE